MSPWAKPGGIRTIVIYPGREVRVEMAKLKHIIRSILSISYHQPCFLLS